MPIREFNIFRRHKQQSIPDLRKAELTPLFRGRPIISRTVTKEEEQTIVELCPTAAIQPSPCRIDLGKCIFCKECEFALPGKISFTNDYKIASNSREGLIVNAGEDRPILLDHERIRKEIRPYFSHALKLRQVSAGGDNSAEMELNAAGNVNFDMGRFGIEFVASPRHADGIVISGPISGNMSQALQICFDAIPKPKMVILCGTDAISGGIFADSRAIDRSFLEKTHVDLFVPGNPPHPLTFINGILDLLGR
jgi:Ni,Fe-hydrogenase III small subunit